MMVKIIWKNFFEKLTFLRRICLKVKVDFLYSNFLGKIITAICAVLYAKKVRGRWGREWTVGGKGDMPPIPIYFALNQLKINTLHNIYLKF